MASKRHIRQKQCGGKVRHVDAGAAGFAKRRAAERGQLVRVYRCPFCHGYHVGHFKPFVVRGRRR